MMLNNFNPQPTPPQARLQVQALQEKLYGRALEDRSKIFDGIYNLVFSLPVLVAATTHVLSGDGANTPGIDGITKKHIEQMGRTRFIQGLQQELKKKSYRPNHLKPKDIPKSNGKMRTLEIPTLKDRIVQKTVTLILEGIFEAGFSSSSHGYRPGLSCHTALAMIHTAITTNSVSFMRTPASRCLLSLRH